MKAIKLLAAIALMGAVAAPAQAKKMSDLKIYINPGHGGYTGNDRPIQIYPFAQNDTLGYWESKSNLYKGLHMYHILDSLGAKPMISRVKNTEKDDRDLYAIAAEANNFGADFFLSIHSNAGEDV
ncbi:MAG: N-acetylmuramoyl-L-alanine amidase, partial [Muribaculaceae bacterium]|nr:N-acetylmuramoyl-L-alanine amidase [Muribaculaceae bacterium]